MYIRTQRALAVGVSVWKENIMKNELYVVKDVPQYSEDVSNYCYVVRATSHNEAIEIVKSKTGYNWEWEASLADNDEVWQ